MESYEEKEFSHSHMRLHLLMMGEATRGYRCHDYQVERGIEGFCCEQNYKSVGIERSDYCMWDFKFRQELLKESKGRCVQLLHLSSFIFFVT